MSSPENTWKAEVRSAESDAKNNNLKLAFKGFRATFYIALDKAPPIKKGDRVIVTSVTGAPEKKSHAIQYLTHIRHAEKTRGILRKLFSIFRSEKKTSKPKKSKGKKGEKRRPKKRGGSSRKRKR